MLNRAGFRLTSSTSSLTCLSTQVCSGWEASLVITQTTVQSGAPRWNLESELKSESYQSPGFPSHEIRAQPTSAFRTLIN